MGTKYAPPSAQRQGKGGRRGSGVEAGEGAVLAGAARSRGGAPCGAGGKTVERAEAPRERERVRVRKMVVRLTRVCPSVRRVFF
jgi:hypothetical protein